MKPITKDSEHIKIEGLPGTWYCLARESYQGNDYFAMDSEGGVGSSVIIDANRKLVADNFQPWLGDIEAHLSGRISVQQDVSLGEHLSIQRRQIEEKLETDYPDIKKMVEAINDSYRAMGRVDRWSLNIDDPSDGPYIFNPLCFGGNAYHGTPEELRDITQKLYSKHFGEPYQPDSPAPNEPTPFFGKIDYLNTNGLVGETILYDSEEKYLRACLARYEYGVPLSGSRITEAEYLKLQQEMTTPEQSHLEIVEEDTLELGGD